MKLPFLPISCLLTLSVGYEPTNTQPLLVPNGIVAIDNQYGQVVHSVSFEGRLMWKFNTSEIVQSVALGRNGTVYVASNNDTKAHPSLPTHGTLTAVTSDGSALWQYKTSCGQAGSVFFGCFTDPLTVGADGTAYITKGNTLLAIDSQGKLSWQASQVSGPAVLGPPSNVYIIGNNGDGNVENLTVLSAVDGTIQWVVEMGGVPSGYSPHWLPAPGNIAPDGSFHLFLPSIDSLSYHNLVKYSAKGKLEWNRSLENVVAADLGFGAVLRDDAIYTYGIYAHNRSSKMFRAYKANGEEKWTTHTHLAFGAPTTANTQGDTFVLVQTSAGARNADFLCQVRVVHKNGSMSIFHELHDDCNYQEITLGKDGSLYLWTNYFTPFSIDRLITKVLSPYGKGIWDDSSYGGYSVGLPAVGDDATVYVEAFNQSYQSRPPYMIQAIAGDGSLKWKYLFGQSNHMTAMLV